ncbi:MAG: GNAT family N-acetyltransferase [Candidatus Micrarchaeia archaeon]
MVTQPPLSHFKYFKIHKLIMIAENKILYESANFLIKEATPADRKALYKLYKEVLFENPSDSVGKKLILVAVDKKTNQVIGGIERAVDTESGYAQGIGFAVSPKFQGMGIGTKLLEVMDDELRRMGIKHITTLPSSEESWKIFKKHGYRYVAAVEEWLKQTGQDRFVKAAMEKDL